tara:strand:+ start:348 stop:1484 length:1137 start_codon:yes stop_codon:yes gene_type:complete
MNLEINQDVQINNLNNINNTKKNRNNNNNNNEKLKKLWNQFDEEFDSNKSKKLECIYINDKINNINNINHDFCTKCNYSLYIGDDNFLTCLNPECGIIYKDNIDRGAEWRFYGADDKNNLDPTRCGMPINPLLYESSFSCKVLCQYKTSYEMHKIKRYSEWQSMPYKEKSQYDDFQYISNISQNSGIPKMIIDDALRFYKKISEAKTYRGLNRDGIIAASIYISCRVNNYPRTAKEIADIFNLDNTSATKGCKNVMTIMNEIEHNDNEEKIVLNKTTPIAFIERYCSKLNINSELTKLCKFIALKIEKQNLIPENTPHSIAAGIIYFISQLCNLNISKNLINNISKISEVTINKCFKKLEYYKLELIPKVILEKYNIQ